MSQNKNFEDSKFQIVTKTELWQASKCDKTHTLKSSNGDKTQKLKLKKVHKKTSCDKTKQQKLQN